MDLAGTPWNGFHLLGMGAASIISLVLAVPALGDSHKPHRPIYDRVDRIEINRIVGEGGKVTLEQVIFWRYVPGYSECVVIDWRSLRTPSQIPYRRDRGYRATWYDTRDSCMRTVDSHAVEETWTDYDPESGNQGFVDRTARVPLGAKGRRR